MPIPPDPYVSGYRAAVDGVPRYGNPHPDRSRPRELWDAGWIAAVRSPRHLHGAIPPPCQNGVRT